MLSDKGEKMTRLEGRRPDPFAFFTGRVVQTFTESESKIEAMDLSSYIDRDNKIIRSITQQLEWDYGAGIVKVDTPTCQGVLGFVGEAGPIRLSDITIDCKNDYATIMVISLDGKALVESEKLLIQAMTEDQLHGWKTEGDTIIRLGEYPINVKEIDAEVYIKNCPQISFVATLDGNGYVKGIPQFHMQMGGLRVKLDRDAIYTVASKEEIPKGGDPLPGNESGSFVWWEGEDVLETNFPEISEFSASTFEEKRHLLSGGDWLSNSGIRSADQEEAYAKYKVSVPETGEYHFWVRKFWHHGPFRWRFDREDWTICKDMGLFDSTMLNSSGVCANWVNLGKVWLEAGEHTFELRLLAEPGEAVICGFDCFVLIRGFFAPRGRLKPGERSGAADDGYWAFEPAVDPFSESPIDLRYLNEKEAGESGFVRKEGFHFVLGNGQPVRFWAVNAGPGMVRQSKEAVDYLARRLAKVGVNMVRIHGAVYDRKSNDLSAIDESYLDYYHYFVYAMKKQGIYVKLSYYFPLWVNMRSEYGIPGYEDMEGERHPFALFQFEEKFQEAYKEWSRKLLLSRNPYTGLPLARDPAVAIIEIQNEDSYLFWTFGRRNIPEAQMEKLERIFGKWLLQKYGSLEAAYLAWGDGSELEKDDPVSGRMMILDIFNLTANGHGEGAKRRRMSDQLQFLVEHQKEFYHKMVDFFRNEIGTKSLISASNWTTADTKTLDSLERYTYTAGDVIDRHGYFGGKHKGEFSAWSVREGHTFEDRSVLKEPEGAIVQVNQVENYPHMITETAWPRPNRYKGEAVPMWALYGALQGMDGIFFFALGSVDWEVNPTSKWPIMVPSVFGQFPAFALLYRRGDVAEADTVVRVTHSLKELYDFKGSPIYETQALDELRKQDKK